MKGAEAAFAILSGLALSASAAVAQRAPTSADSAFRGSPASARVVEVRLEPDPAPFAQAFELHVVLRVSTDRADQIPDTLVPSYAVESIGPGSLGSPRPVEGDSSEIRAVYPVIAFREGEVDLPVLELRGDGAASSTPVVLGRVEVAPFPPLAVPDAEAEVRPPADVAGKNWNTGVLVGGSIFALVLLGGSVRALTLRVRGGEGRSPAASSLSTSPASARARALLELDRIRDEGGHRDGRVADFYDETTGVLRRYAEDRDLDRSRALTSLELVSILAGDEVGTGAEVPDGDGDGQADVQRTKGHADVHRTLAERRARLRRAVVTAEHVKFGTARPGAGRAEADWSAVRSWIEGEPEA